MTKIFSTKLSLKKSKKQIAALALLFVPIGCSMGGASQTLVGYVQSSATDENDNPTEIFLFDGKNEYRIEKGKVQRELLDLVDRKISAQVVISDGWGGKKEIDIEEYKVVE